MRTPFTMRFVGDRSGPPTSAPNSKFAHTVQIDSCVMVSELTEPDKSMLLASSSRRLPVNH